MKWEKHLTTSALEAIACERHQDTVGDGEEQVVNRMDFARIILRSVPGIFLTDNLAGFPFSGCHGCEP